MYNKCYTLYIHMHSTHFFILALLVKPAQQVSDVRGNY